MDSVGTYILSVTAAGILCGIVTSILGEKSSYSGVIKMMAGIFLAVSVVKPLVNIRLGSADGYLSDLNIDGQTAAEVGIQMSEDAMNSIIKSKVEAYILDKAASLGVKLSVEVRVENGSIPQISNVRLTGPISPYAKQQLSSILCADLGIAKEKLKWN